MSGTVAAKPPVVPPEQAAIATLCDHCGLVVPRRLVEPDDDLQFCCGGCRVAYETIHACGLDEYYSVRDRLANSLQPSTGSGGRYAAYDSDTFLEKYAADAPSGGKSIEFRLEGVHCAACVWLIERLPRVVPGVVEARLSLAASSVRIVWDPQQTQLSIIAASLDSLGYAPHPARDTSARDVRNATERARLIRMAIAGALAGNNMLIALALYAGVFDGIEPRFALLFRWLSMGIGLVSLAWPGRSFFTGAWSALKTQTANLDLPIAIALGVGAAAGTANVLLNRGEVYFDSLSVLVFLLLVGRFVQARQQRWAGDAVGRMFALTPDSCRVRRGDAFVEEPVETLAVGDVVEVRAGDLFPADGEVMHGESAIDRSLLTGESQPESVAGGDAVFAGCQNVDATLQVNVQAVGHETRAGNLMRLVDEGLQAKPRIVQFADRVGGWFVLVVVSIAAMNFAGWATTVGIISAIDTTVALLIVACPCALGLATPLTLAIAIGQASRQGVLIKSSDVLEQLAVEGNHAGRLILDKTGTLTQGSPSLVAWHGELHWQYAVAAIEAESNHPIAKALATPELLEDCRCPRFWDRKERQGHGVSATIEEGEIAVGSARWIAKQGSVVAPEFAARIAEGLAHGYTTVAVAVDQQVVAVVWLADLLHQDAKSSIEQLRAGGWQCEILSGDAPGPVKTVSDQLGISRPQVHAEATPEAKLALIKSAAAEQPEQQTIVMIGDGVNDAAALAAADVGIAVHGGAEAALVAADVYASKPGVSSILALVQLSRRTMQVVRRNLGISLAYNTLAVGLAAAGLLSPLVAAVLMPISSATVLGSAIYGLARPIDAHLTPKTSEGGGV
ncbi:MAG: heavy metal translocating P-type ATPase [Planctomycetota bacterium]